MRLHEISRPKTRQDANRILLAAGYKRLGTPGMFGAVYEKPGRSYVVKIFTARDLAYLDFVRLAQMHQDNPHFPRFFGKLLRITKDVYGIRTEKLTPFVPAKVGDYAYALFDYIQDGQDDGELKDYPELKKACDLVRKNLLSHYHFDFKDQSFMMRDNIIVITDPVLDLSARDEMLFSPEPPLDPLNNKVSSLSSILDTDDDLLKQLGINETFMYPIGSKMPNTIIDYRDPKNAEAGFRPYTDEQLAFFNSDDYTRKFGQNKNTGYEHEVPDTKLVLTKDGKVIVFFYGNENIIPWAELLDILRQNIDDELQDDATFGISVYEKGFLINSIREIGGWGGDRTKYSFDVKRTVQALLDRKVATPRTSIYLGKERKNTLIGTVSQILKSSTTPNNITVYHGTSSYRWHHIEKNGLKALPVEDRVWNKGGIEKTRPEHREDSVYLTASLHQAEYYARKAVNTDRARSGPSKRSDAYHLKSNIERQIPQLEWNKAQVIKNPDELVSDYYNGPKRKRLPAEWYQEQIDKLKANLEKIQPLLGYYGKIESVILEITLDRSEYKYLRADDDYLARKYSDMKERNQHAMDWRDSLSEFGQIAYQGTIPPSKIKVLKNEVS